MLLDQERTPLVTALRESCDRPNTPFYAPGHKRGKGISPLLTALLGQRVFRADLPELPELDNLFAPEGVIREAQELAAEAFGAEQTWFLANGSTCGIEAAVLATCNPGEKIILPRNSHQSAIAALILSGAMPIFVQPEYSPDWGIAHSVTPDGVAAALQAHPDARAVMMVCPTYYGLCGDVEAIAHLAHSYNIPLLVDEAHGAHFAFHPDLPTPALAAGADLVVQSTHKTLGAMTQASMLHIQGNLIDPDRLSRALRLVQSTSPSYLLLASLDAARQQMALSGKALLSRTLELGAIAHTQLTTIPGLRLLSLPPRPGCLALDPTRLTVDVSGTGMTGFEVDEMLHQKFGVTAELPGLRTLTFILTLGNTTKDMERLVGSLRQVGKVEKVREGSVTCPPTHSPIQTITPRAAFFSPAQTLPIEQVCDRLSAELVCPYPPGIPALIPGERITPDALEYLQQVLKAGGVITGCADSSLQTLRVIDSNSVA